MQTLLAEEGLNASFVQDMGEAKHVFTHRVWNMKLLHYELEQFPDAAILEKLDAQMLSHSEMQRLPFPTAMSAAVKAVQELLET